MNLPNDLRERILDRVKALTPEIQESLRWLYDHPELSGEEYESSRFLGHRAEAHGFKVEYGVAGLPTAFAARSAPSATDAGPTLAYLAEYDALPTIGHGCGHNMIGTVGTYAAIALAESLGGTREVRLYGTPAEETFGGKITMLDAGVFQGVGACMMMHPGLDTEVAYSSLASKPVIGEFRGQTAHAAASPWKGRNALDAVIQLFVLVDMARKQLPPTVRMPGIIVKGGERPNMVPDHTVCAFSLRGKDKEEAELVFSRWIECAEAAARATQCEFSWKPDGNFYYDMRPDAELAKMFAECWNQVGGDKPIEEAALHGSLDIGNLSHVFPCLHPSIKITHDRTIGGHTTEFRDATLTDYGMEQGVKAIAALAMTGAMWLHR